MSHRIRVIAKRREEVDLDKLCFALLRIIEQEQLEKQSANPPQQLPPPGGERTTKETAA